MGKRKTTAVEAKITSTPLKARWKIWASALILLHVLAVFIGPFSFFTRSGRGISPSAATLRDLYSPYIEFAYLNHGYFFFAPNPGPSHLLECKLIGADGSTSRLRLPDRKVQWPRLLYHRHFMLAEFLHSHHVPPAPQAEGEPSPEQVVWEADRARFVLIRDSMIKHLKTRYSVADAEILRLEHRLPSSVEVFDERIPLFDERLYTVLPDAPLLDVPPLVNPLQAPIQPTLQSPLQLPANPSAASATKEVLAPEVIQQVQP